MGKTKKGHAKKQNKTKKTAKKKKKKIQKTKNKTKKDKKKVNVSWTSDNKILFKNNDGMSKYSWLIVMV